MGLWNAIKSLFGGSGSENQIQDMESSHQDTNDNDESNKALEEARNMTVDQALAKAQNNQHQEAHKDLSKPVFPNAEQYHDSPVNTMQPDVATPVSAPQNSPAPKTTYAT